jgi:hypothetical protein
MEFPKPQDNINTVTLSNEFILELYNNQPCTKQSKKDISIDVVLWIKNMADSYGWEVLWNAHNDNLDGCTLNKLKLKKVLSNSLEELLATSFSKVAQHACRQGENGTRSWPPLSTLPNHENWKDVGKQYAKEFSIQLLELYLSKGNFVEDIAKTAGR